MHVAWAVPSCKSSRQLFCLSFRDSSRKGKSFPGLPPYIHTEYIFLCALDGRRVDFCLESSSSTGEPAAPRQSDEGAREKAFGMSSSEMCVVAWLGYFYRLSFVIPLSPSNFWRVRARSLSLLFSPLHAHKPCFRGHHNHARATLLRHRPATFFGVQPWGIRAPTKTTLLFRYPFVQKISCVCLCGFVCRLFLEQCYSTERWVGRLPRCVSCVPARRRPALHPSAAVVSAVEVAAAMVTSMKACLFNVSRAHSHFFGRSSHSQKTRTLLLYRETSDEALDTSQANGVGGGEKARYPFAISALLQYCSVAT